jgi:N-acetylneuraminic acid mutarotase
VAQAIFNELRNDIGEDGEKNEDSNNIFATYIDRDSSDKPDGVTKMLKV